MRNRIGSSSPNAMPRILLIEEEQNLRYSMALMLKQAGCVVNLIGGVMEAAALLKKNQGGQDAFDLFIVDLGDASGEACRGLVEWFDGEGILVPYLVLVEDVGDRAGEYLTENGCLACISKPFEPSTLLNAVCRAIGREWIMDQSGVASWR